MFRSAWILTVLATLLHGSAAVRKQRRSQRAVLNVESNSTWDPRTMKMTHYWDCNGQGCDSVTLQPWNPSKYVSPPGYGPQVPDDYGGAVYGEKMWMTGAASDALSNLLGADDGRCGGSEQGGCGKCLLIQVPDAVQSSWTAVVMKKNRCPPHTNGCAANTPHFDVAAPGFDNLQYSTANICGRPGTGFANRGQSEALGTWYNSCPNTAACAHLCDKLEPEFRKGCKLFASWGWRKGDPSGVRFRPVECPAAFVQYVSGLFDKNGAVASGGDSSRRRSGGTGGGCCKFGADCGDCGNDGAGWCHTSASNCAACTGIFDATAPKPTCGIAPAHGCCKFGADCGDCGEDGSGWCHQSSANCGTCGGRLDGNAVAPTCM